VVFSFVGVGWGYTVCGSVGSPEGALGPMNGLFLGVCVLCVFIFRILDRFAWGCWFWGCNLQTVHAGLWCWGCTDLHI